MFTFSDTSPESTHIARSLLTLANNETERRVQFHQSCFDAIWRNPLVPAHEVLAAMGTNAARYFQAASESVRHIAEIAAISGLTLDQVLPAADRAMPVEVILHEDGTATLAEA